MTAGQSAKINQVNISCLHAPDVDFRAVFVVVEQFWGGVRGTSALRDTQLIRHATCFLVAADAAANVHGVLVTAADEVTQTEICHKFQ